MLAHVISLSNRKDRRSRIEVSFKNRGLDYIFIDAIQFTDDKYGSGKDEILFYHQSNGSKGCFLSHYLLIEKAYQEQKSGILIMEDDVYTMSINAKEIIEHAIDNLPPNTYIAHLEYMLHAPKNVSRYNHQWFRVHKNSIWSTGAYYITYEGISFFMETLNTIRKELYHKIIDAFMSDYIYPTGNCYALYPQLAYQDYNIGSSITENEVNFRKTYGNNVYNIVNTSFRYISNI